MYELVGSDTVTPGRFSASERKMEAIKISQKIENPTRNLAAPQAQSLPQASLFLLINPERPFLTYGFVYTQSQRKSRFSVTKLKFSYPSSKIRPCPSFLKTWGVQDASEILDIGQAKDNEKGFISRSVIPSGQAPYQNIEQFFGRFSIRNEIPPSILNLTLPIL